MYYAPTARRSTFRCAAGGMQKKDAKLLKDQLIMLSNKADTIRSTLDRAGGVPSRVLTAVESAIKSMDAAADAVDNYAGTLS